MGTRLKRHEFSLPATWNRRGTPGTPERMLPKEPILLTSFARNCKHVSFALGLMKNRDCNLSPVWDLADTVHAHSRGIVANEANDTGALRPKIALLVVP